MLLSIVKKKKERQRGRKEGARKGGKRRERNMKQKMYSHNS